MPANVWAIVGGNTFSLPMETLLGTANQLLGMNAAATELQYKNAKFNNVTGQLEVPVGAVGVPSYSFTGQLDSGWFFDGTGIVLTIGGIKKLGVSASAAQWSTNVQFLSKLLQVDLGANIVAAATTNLGTATGNSIHLTHAAGNVIITSLGGDTLPAGTEIETIVLITGGTLTLQHNAVSLILLSNADIILQHEDIVRWRKINDASPFWRMVGFQRQANTGVLTTKGDLLVGLGAGNTDRLGTGPAEYTLIPDVALPKGLVWKDKIVPEGNIHGLTLSINAADASNDIDIAIGIARDDSNVVSLRLSSILTKRIDAPWVVGTNQGGMLTGAVVDNTLYGFWLIGRSDTGVVDAGFDPSLTAPTMPANYDRKVLIGAMWRGTAVNRVFYQDGGFFKFQAPVTVVSAGTATVDTAVVLTTAVPSIAKSFTVSADVSWTTNDNVLGDNVCVVQVAASVDYARLARGRALEWGSGGTFSVAGGAIETPNTGVFNYRNVQGGTTSRSSTISVHGFKLSR